MNELISDEAVCRTAPATPGLLNMLKYMFMKVVIIEYKKMKTLLHFPQHSFFTKEVKADN